MSKRIRITSCVSGKIMLRSATGNLFVYAILLLILYSIPFNSQVTLNEHHVAGMRLDHLLHLLLFIPIPLLVRKTLFRNPVRVTLLLVLAAVIVEGMHLIVPERSFSVFDIFANVTGILIGTGVSFLVKRN